MKTPSLVAVWIGLAIANIICAPTMEIALDRSAFQAIAILSVFLTPK
jgi:hypothetical protein